MIPAQPTNADNHRPLRDMNPSETDLRMLSTTRLTNPPVRRGITAIDAK